MRKWLKLCLLAIFSLFLADSTPGQGSLANFPVWRYTPAGAFPASSAIVTVCTSSATGTPCTPTATVFQDAALSIPVVLVNGGLPLCTTSPQIGCLDNLGNVTFYATPGVYTYTVTGSGLRPYGPITLQFSCVAGSTCVATSTNNIFTGINNFDANTYFGSGSPWIDVKSNLYNAVCNGSTDDSTAINAASTAASSASVGASSVVYIPQGNCDVKSQVVNKQGSIFRGEDKGSSILADATFPASTPLVKVGSVALNDVTRVEHLVVDCNGVTGCNGLSTTTAQELSGADYVTVRRAMGFGVDVESNAQNSMWSNIQVGSGAAAPGTFEGFRINTNAAVKTTIFNTTVTPSVGSITSCIHDVQGVLFAYSIHCEDATDGIRFDSGAFGMVHGFTGASSNTNAVKINAGSGAVFLSEIESNGGTNTVNDTDCAVTLSADNVIPFYAHSHTGSKCAWLDSSGFHASQFAGNLTLLGQNCPTGSGSVIGIICVDNTDAFLHSITPNNVQNQVPQVFTLTSQYINSTTGFTPTAISWNVRASTNYTATCHLYYQAAATGGLNIEFTVPAAPTSVTYGLNLPLSLTTFNNVVATAASTSLGATVTTATTNFDAVVSFSLINGANSGTVTLLAKSSAAVQLQIQTGSYCVVQ